MSLPSSFGPSEADVHTTQESPRRTLVICVYVAELCKQINVNDMQINFRTARFGLMFMAFEDGYVRTRVGCTKTIRTTMDLNANNGANGAWNF